MIHEISDSIWTNRNIITLPQKIKSRYIRYNSAPNNRIELAEFELFDDTTQISPLPMKIAIGVEAMHTDDQFALKNVFDGNPLSFFRSMDSTVSVIFDLGKLTEIKKIMLIPRNDENFVWPGDLYELNYQNGNKGWKSLGYIAIDDANRKFYVSDHGKQKVFSYDLDSVLANSLYMPKEKAKMKGLEFPSEYQYVNDTLSLGIIIKPTGNSGFNQLVANWNISTGEIIPMTYEHPDIENKRVNIAVSIEDKIYVECYSHYDLMTICALNGNLKWNIYGPKWNKEKTKTTHYEGVVFCKNRILASYSGKNSFIEEKGRGKKVNFPTQFIVFDANGNYIQTLETGYQITDFCYDIKNNRILMSLEDEIQFGYLDLDGILK